jgi:membrane fusion protein, multidrug efflux system
MRPGHDPAGGRAATYNGAVSIAGAALPDPRAEPWRQAEQASGSGVRVPSSLLLRATMTRPALRRLLPALSLLAAVLAGCGSKPAPQQRGAAPAVVTTATVASVPWNDAIEALGTAQANESVTLTAKVTETVDRVNFDDGDLASTGQVLVDLSGRAEVAQLEEEHAAYKEAQKQLDRQSELVKQGTIARSQMDTQVAARDAARARMDAIRARLSDRVITAPFDGVLGFRRVSPGTLVTPGTEIATLDDISVIKLDFPIPESFLGNVAAGQKVEALSAAWPDARFEGQVRAIDSRVDPVTRAVTVRAEIPNPEARLRPGMLLTVRLLRPERQALVIPEIALLQVGAKSFVYRVGDGARVEQVEVQTGARRRGEVEIVAGLAAGERIVVEGTVKLRPGAVIAEAQAPAAAPAAVTGNP